eukprot:7943428-Pyramimonas_sp.AAC.1
MVKLDYRVRAYGQPRLVPTVNLNKRVHALRPHPNLVSTLRCGYMLSPLPRLVPAAGIFSLPLRDWFPLR